MSLPTGYSEIMRMDSGKYTIDGFGGSSILASKAPTLKSVFGNHITQGL